MREEITKVLEAFILPYKIYWISRIQKFLSPDLLPKTRTLSNFKSWTRGDNNIIKLFNLHRTNKNDVWKHAIGHRCDRSRYIVYTVLSIYIKKKSANSRSDNEHLQVPTYVHDIFEHTTKISSKQKFCVTLAQVKIDWSTKVNNSCNLMSKITLDIYVS